MSSPVLRPSTVFRDCNGDGLTSAAIWHDYVTPESDRLTFTWAVAAAEHEAVLANYVEAIELLRDGRRVVGVRAANRLDGRQIEIGARVTVNATGGAVDRLLSGSQASTGIPLLKAMNLVTRRDAGAAALGGRSASGRHLFLVPWRGRAIFGTWESARTCGGGEAVPTAAEIAGFIAEINEAFPTLALAESDVTLVHCGAVPAIVANGRIALQGHEQVRDHASQGLDGIVSVAGVKYTTARAVAERVTDTVVAKLRRSTAPCRTGATPLPGGDLVTSRRRRRRLAASTAISPAARYPTSSRPTVRDIGRCSNSRRAAPSCGRRWWKIRR